MIKRTLNAQNLRHNVFFCRNMTNIYVIMVTVMMRCQMNKIYVTKPFLPSLDEYTIYLKQIWENGILTNCGPLHENFKGILSEKYNTNVSLFTNGHLALESAIKALDLPKDGEVITTPFTFVSTTHAIVNNGLTPVFCDIKLDDYTIDENKIEDLITDKTSAIVAVHVYGYPCNVAKIEEIAKKHNLKVIYDSAHAFNVKLNGKSILEYGDLSMVSFHATKIFHTIEGGMVASKDVELIQKIDKIKNFGITGPETVELTGTNAKMNEFQAAMGLCVLPHLEDIIEKRKNLYNLYKSLLLDVKGITFVKLADNVNYNYAYLPIIINDDDYGLNRDDLSDMLASNEIYSRKYFSPCVNEFECYSGKYNEENLQNSNYVSKRILTLPLYPDLAAEDVERICKIIKR